MDIVFKPNVAFLTPANAMLAVELTNVADMLDDAKSFKNKNIPDMARSVSKRVTDAIWNSTVGC